MKLPTNNCGEKDFVEDNKSNNKMDSNNNMNFDENDSNNINTRTSNLDILSYILPPFRSQSAPNSPRRHGHRSRRLGNSNINNTTTTSTTTSSSNNNSSNSNDSNNNSNSNRICSRRIQSPKPPMSRNTGSLVTSQDSVLDINSNITFKHRDSLEDSSSDSLDRSDLDNDNDVTKRRKSYYFRSDSLPSCEDSGFSSSNCLSDDKDDISLSINNSFDFENGNEIGPKRDSFTSIQHPFPLSSLTVRSRVRTFSLDSTSSDLSDSNTSEINPKLSISLPHTCIYNDSSISNKNNDKSNLNSNKPSFTSEQTNLTSIDVVKRRSFKSRSRRNSTKSSSNASSRSSSIISVKDASTVISHEPVHLSSESESDTDNESDQETDNDHNNNCADFPCKNLSSRIDAVIPFRFADLFHSHGLITVIACIFYTIFLLFVFGGLALSCGILKKFVNMSDLKDLRENMLESRRKREVLATRTRDLDGGS